MRIDHIAYRVKDRYKTSKFFIDALGYGIGTEFQIEFDDGSKADCVALTPPEDRPVDTEEWDVLLADAPEPYLNDDVIFHGYHCPSEIFVSDGPDGSIVGDWVVARGGIGGVHHIAYQVDDVEAKMNEWKEKGYAEFLSESPLTCPGLEQVFTKPSELTGIIYELIRRKGKGFCVENVKALMESTSDVETDEK